MKITKMSLVAALLIGSSAFAIENTKVTGDVNVYYNTTDAGTKSLLEAGNSAADIGLNLNASADLMKSDAISISTGAGLTVLTTLGLENNLVDGVWGSSHTATLNGSSYSAKVENVWWVNEAWLAITAGKSTVKVGRMALDTPLAFTETWSIEKNTFEAAVLINQDIPDTTLVGAYVGNGNGTADSKISLSNGTRAALAVGGVVNTDGQFTTYGGNGAYAIGAINNSFEPLTAQAWYYDVSRLASAYWLQADLNMEGILLGAQYTAIEAWAAGSTKNTAYALMAGYEMKDMFTAKLAYSATSSDGTLGHVGYNTAINADTAQSKLYTEAWWSYGRITQKDTQSFNVTVESPVNGIVDLGAYYTSADQSVAAGDKDLAELTLTAGKSFGPLDTTLVYSNIKSGVNADAYNQVQVYLTVNF